LYTNYPSAHVANNYLRLSGTSMATAVTSGAVALVLEANQRAHPGAPPLTPNAVKAILQYSSLPMFDGMGVPYDSLTQGAGALNAAGAISLASAIDTRTPAGWYWWTTSVSPFTTLAGETWTWVQHLLWGTRLLSGSPVDTNQTAWALNHVWGGQSVWGSHIVWGDDVVWGSDESVWSTHIVWGDNYVGSSTDGQHIVWGSADQPNDTSWGNLAGASTWSSSSTGTTSSTGSTGSGATAGGSMF
jgi:serine protease AprX